MTETRICHHCNTVVGSKQSCPTCEAWLSNQPDPKTMTGEDRALEVRKWLDNDTLEITLGLMLDRLDLLVGRSIYTHELAYNVEGLVSEALAYNPDMPLSDEQVESIALDCLPDSVKAKTLIMDYSSLEAKVMTLDEYNDTQADSFTDTINDLDV